MEIITYNNIAHKLLLKQTKCFRNSSHVFLHSAHWEQTDLSKQSMWISPVIGAERAVSLSVNSWPRMCVHFSQLLYIVVYQKSSLSYKNADCLQNL